MPLALMQQAEDLSSEQRALYERCPYRGRRLPEVACGDFVSMLDEFSTSTSSNMLVGMSSTLSRIPV